MEEARAGYGEQSILLAPDGRVFFIELGGKLKAWRPDTKQIVVAATAFIVVRAARRDPVYPEPETLPPAG